MRMAVSIRGLQLIGRLLKLLDLIMFIIDRTEKNRELYHQKEKLLFIKCLHLSIHVYNCRDAEENLIIGRNS